MLRKLASFAVFPALTVGPMLAALWGLDRDYSHSVVIATCVAGSLLLQFFLELALPYRDAWQARRRIGPDLGFVLLAVAVAGILDVTAITAVYGLSAWISRSLGMSLWPLGWPLAAQFALAMLIAELGHYLAHRALHDVPLLWRFHRLHHSPDHVYCLNFFRMHPVEIALKTLANIAPLILLGVPTEILALWSVLSGVAAGSVNHCNVDMRTDGLDLVLSTPAAHRFHHAARTGGRNRNLGNVTLIFDRLFGTYFCPTGRDVGAVGLR